MRIEHFALIFLLAVLASAGDGGCSGDPGDDGDRPIALDGGFDLLDVRGRTLATGPFLENQSIHLAAEASGGVPPYRFQWRAPAVTLEPDLGYGEVISGKSSFVVTVQARDARGEIATDSFTIEVASSAAAVLEIEIEGDGRVDAGALGSCERERCAFDVELHDALPLNAIALNDAHFTGWSGCSTSTSAAIDVEMNAAEIRCSARFVLGNEPLRCDAVPPPPGPSAVVVVRPSSSEPPFAKDGEGFYRVPRNVHVTIDGSGSRTVVTGGLGYQWTSTWDPLSETPSASVAFFTILTPGFNNERAEAYLTVFDGCGRTATATATYVTE